MMLSRLLLAALVFATTAHADTILVNPNDVKANPHVSTNAYTDNDGATISVRDETFHFDGWDVIKEANTLNSTVAQAKDQGKWLAVDMGILGSLMHHKDFNVAFSIVNAPPAPKAKRFSVWAFTKPALPNKNFKFCVTAIFASSEPQQVCPGANTNLYGQFTVEPFEFKVTKAGDRVVHYAYELFTDESESPHSPSHKDLFGDSDLGSEQHANLEFHIHLADAPTVEADVDAGKRPPTPAAEAGPSDGSDPKRDKAAQ